MKLKKVFLFVLFVLILTACGQQDRVVDGAVDTEPIFKAPPELIVVSNSNKVVAAIGTYSWSYDNGDGTSTSIEADSDIPPKIVHHQSTSLSTNLGSDVNLEYDKVPERIKVNIWGNSQIIRGVKVEDASFRTDEKGYVIYEIYAKWDQGSAHYAVKINIQ